jgi:DNA-binding transcriptional MerR regulator
MDKNLPEDKKLVSIGKAAEILGVSIDTIRRWEKGGTLKCERPNGKDRFFSVKELEKHKFSKPLSISQASEQLGISATTLRRLEKKGIIKPERNSNGERMYDRDSLKSLLNSQYSLKQEFQDKIPEPLEPPKEELKEEPIAVETTEKIDSHLEGKNLAGNAKDYSTKASTDSSEEIYLDRNLKPLQRIPEIAACAIVFALLVTFGIRNITLPASQRPELSVLGIKTVASMTENKKPFPTPSPNLTSTPTPSLTLAPSPTSTPTPSLSPAPVATSSSTLGSDKHLNPNIILTVLIKNATGSASVNIRQKPTASSQIVAKAKNGDNFVFVTFDSGWYGVRLPDGSTGFIFGDFIQEENN